MKLDGHEEWSQLTSAVSDVKAATATEPLVRPGVRISKPTDRSSPALLQACGDGSLIKRVTLAWRDADGLVFRITLENARVLSFVATVSPGVPLLEQCALTFDTIEWSWFGHDGEDVLIGGDGAHYDVPAQLATLKSYLPFRASLEPVAGRRMMKLVCPVERGRTYRISTSTSLNGDWQKLEDFTAPEDGHAERLLPDTAARLFLRVEALD
jgi:type VI protein secretion system component Hcp